MPYNTDSSLEILFAASSGAALWIERYQSVDSEYRIVDNDPALHGSEFHGTPVDDPKCLTEIEFSKVIVLIADVEEAFNQLRNLGIPRSAIFVPPKPMFRPQPFFDPTTRAAALQLIRVVVGWATNIGLPIVLEQGAVLGLWRSRDLIPWDNDLDFSVPSDHIPKLNLLVEEIRRSDLFHDVVNQEINGAQQISFSSKNPNIPFSVYTRHIKNGIAKSPDADFIQIREESLWPARWLEVSGFRYPLPGRTEAYLEEIYGTDWSKPKPEFTFLDYPQHKLVEDEY